MKNLPGEPGFRLQVSLLLCFWRLDLTLDGAVDFRRRRRRRHGRHRRCRHCRPVITIVTAVIVAVIIVIVSAACSLR